MQVLFGVVGDSRPAGEVFARLLADTLDSNPGLDVAVESDRETVLGHAGRSFAMWQDAGSDRSFYLDGAIRAIDGRETGQLGTSERELELLAALFGLHGPAIWERLDGSFCLIIRDGLDVHIGVDVGGTRSVYWWFDEGLLGFHSHLVDLAPAFPGALTEDPAALGMYLECEQYPPGATAYRQIRHLGAGQAMSLVGGQVLTRTHFRMAFDDPLTVGRRPGVSTI